MLQPPVEVLTELLTGGRSIAWPRVAKPQSTCGFLEQPQRDSNPCLYLERVERCRPVVLGDRRSRLQSGFLPQGAQPWGTFDADSVPQHVPQVFDFFRRYPPGTYVDSSYAVGVVGKFADGGMTP